MFTSLLKVYAFMKLKMSYLKIEHFDCVHKNRLHIFLVYFNLFQLAQQLYIV